MKVKILFGLILVLTVIPPLRSQVSAKIFLLDGQSVGISTVNTIRIPFTNEEGKVACTFGLVDGDNGIWYDTTYIHLNSEINSHNLTSAENTMGIGEDGKFIFSPSIEGDDAAWNQDGPILIEGDQAPDFPNGVVSTFNSRPQMFGASTAYWIGGVNLSGGNSTDIRVLFKKVGQDTTHLEYKVGDTLSSGLVLDQLGFDYCASDNDSFLIHEAEIIAVSENEDGIILLNGDSILAREFQPTGQGDNWDVFDFVSINNQGNYVWSGTTDGNVGSDEYIALNGEIVLLEGDTLAGIPLAASMLVQALSINDFGKIAFILSYAEGVTLFQTDIHDFKGNAQVIASVGDFIDVDNNMINDYELEDFNSSTNLGNGIDLSEHNFVFCEVDLKSIIRGGGPTELEAIVRFDMDCPEFIYLQNPFDNVLSDIPLYAEADSITANNVIGATANVGYDASKSIILGPGFEVKKGGLFEARIDGCGGLIGPIEP